MNDTLQFDDYTMKTYNLLLLSIGPGEATVYRAIARFIIAKRKNKLVDYLGIKGLNHYQMIHELGKTGSILAKFMLNRGHRHN